MTINLFILLLDLLQKTESSMFSSYILNLAKQLWGKKWRTPIMWLLKDQPLRFSEIKKNLPGCSVKVLSSALKEMEANHLITRTEHGGIPPKVVYELNPELKMLNNVLETYLKQLTVYFYNNAEKYDIPESIIKELRHYIDTNK